MQATFFWKFSDDEPRVASLRFDPSQLDIRNLDSRILFKCQPKVHLCVEKFIVLFILDFRSMYFFHFFIAFFDFYVTGPHW